MNVAGLYLLTLLSMAGFKDATEPKANLTISISNLHDTDHSIYVAVSRDSPGFPDRPDMAKKILIQPSGKNNVSIVLSDLPYGRYAVIIFQDVNSNKKLDKNFLGIPTEPFAFSNIDHLMFRAPRWEECAFDYNAISNKVMIKKLIKI